MERKQARKARTTERKQARKAKQIAQAFIVDLQKVAS